jgi:transposase
VLKTGMPWQMLPTELGYGSGSTCWRRFHAWTQLGVWPKLHQHLLRVLGRRGRINLERAVIDSASMRALKGGRTPARTPPIGARRAASVTS